MRSQSVDDAMIKVLHAYWPKGTPRHFSITGQDQSWYQDVAQAIRQRAQDDPWRNYDEICAGLILSPTTLKRWTPAMIREQGVDIKEVKSKAGDVREIPDGIAQPYTKRLLKEVHQLRVHVHGGVGGPAVSAVSKTQLVRHWHFAMAEGYRREHLNDRGRNADETLRLRLHPQPAGADITLGDYTTLVQPFAANRDGRLVCNLRIEPTGFAKILETGGAMMCLTWHQALREHQWEDRNAHQRYLAFHRDALRLLTELSNAEAEAFAADVEAMYLLETLPHAEPVSAAAVDALCPSCGRQAHSGRPCRL